MKKGQATVLLLVFTAMTITIASTAVLVLINNSLSSSQVVLSNDALAAAESGTEDALLQILRDPDNYQGGVVTLPVGAATVTISPGGFPKTLTTVGAVNNLRRTIRVVVGYNDNTMTILSWKEI